MANCSIRQRPPGVRILSRKLLTLFEHVILSLCSTESSIFLLFRFDRKFCLSRLRGKESTRTFLKFPCTFQYAGTYYTTAEGTTYYTADPNAGEAGPIVLVDGSQLQVSGVNVAGAVGQVGIAQSDAREQQQIALALQSQTAEAILKAASQGQLIATQQGGQAGQATPYQTVTIMPTDNNPGEVSYVLIMSQEPTPAGTTTTTLQPMAQAITLKKDPQDISVYEFDEGKQQPQVVAARQPEEKARSVKVVSKKVVQTITQAHMCSYCNYTSPKRYLLSRHMKSHSEDRPHKCSVCERGFKTLASLQNHVNTHTGTRPHQCKECDASFTTSGELVRHVR